MQRNLALAPGRHIAAGVGVDQTRLGAEVTSLQLMKSQLLQGRAGRQQTGRQVQQFAHPRIEGAHARVGIEHQYPLADTGQRRLQQPCLVEQLLIEFAQRGLSLLAFRDVGMGPDQAQGLALRIAAHHHATGKNPFPGAVLAAQAQVNGVVR